MTQAAAQFGTVQKNNSNDKPGHNLSSLDSGANANTNADS